MVILMEVMEAMATNMAIPMEDMADMARDLLTLARTTLSQTEELQRPIPRLMLKQVGLNNEQHRHHINFKLNNRIWPWRLWSWRSGRSGRIWPWRSGPWIW